MKSLLREERIDPFPGMIIHNESQKLPGHKARMLGHFKRTHRLFNPVKYCTCGICVPNSEFDWDKLAEDLVRT